MPDHDAKRLFPDYVWFAVALLVMLLGSAAQGSLRPVALRSASAESATTR